ncbi:CDP-diacylglycerol--glycerol-3-phosphate 3-phosphatidyltransferase [Candidatus Xenohaliotis californiensis]|uniref:CDP-diacylglycerol--glycerol-3-phosphate 3-phosphatidyltransferase n=1 Tax=Candidatus Xenohaliotis californiensis TaxID=84677 RepID=A0ABP0EW33_9RICK|nr:CDP-diacylglycerol--glycerol-3-phosphate 3-phosphatidyltransferase [Candidatus Xenohaliotis californiensis]
MERKSIQIVLPNILTISRLVVIPLLIGSFYMAKYWSMWPVAVIFVCASITDFLDGYLARYWSTQSRFGAIMDPIADKIIVITTIVMLINFQIIDKFTIMPALIIICREILISGLREYAAKEGIVLHVTYAAKIKTAIQMLALLMLIIFSNGIFSVVFLWFAAVISTYSALKYCRNILSS